MVLVTFLHSLTTLTKHQAGDREWREKRIQSKQSNLSAMRILPWAINVFGFVGAGGLAMLLKDPSGPCSCEGSEAKEGAGVSLLSPCPCGRHRDLHCTQT